MRLRDDDTLDPQVERELAAIDAALRGDAVDYDLADLGELSTEIAELRSGPEEDFAARMDRDVATGFEAGERREGLSGLASAWERFRTESLTRRLMPVGAVALASVVAVTAVVSLNGGDGSRDDSAVTSDSAGTAQSSGGADSGGGSGAEIAPPAPGAADSAAPNLSPTGAAPANGLNVEPYSRSLNLTPAGLRLKKNSTGPYAAGKTRRAIERDAQITLGTDPEKVQDVSSDVLRIVGRYQGIVLNSSVSDGPAGNAGAEFELLIPSARLGDALSDLSGVAEVRSREENTKDITAPTVTVEDRLREARAEVEGLLKQLAAADTDEERQSAEGQLAFQRQRVAGLRSTLNGLKRRANLSHVALDIVTGDASQFGSTGDGQWTVGDALRDAGKILGTAAGVTLIGLAILAPFALLALLAWIARRGWVGQSRRRALEG